MASPSPEATPLGSRIRVYIGVLCGLALGIPLGALLVWTSKSLYPPVTDPLIAVRALGPPTRPNAVKLDGPHALQQNDRAAPPPMPTVPAMKRSPRRPHRPPQTKPPIIRSSPQPPPLRLRLESWHRPRQPQTRPPRQRLLQSRPSLHLRKHVKDAKLRVHSTPSGAQVLVKRTTAGRDTI